MLRIIIMLIMYLLQICMYAAGSKALFGIKQKRKWLFPTVGGICCLVAAGMVTTEKQYEAIFLSTYLLAIILEFYLIDGRTKNKLIAVLSIFCISICTDEILGIFLKHIFPILESFDEVHSIVETCLSIIIFIILGKTQNGIKRHIKQFKFSLSKHAIIVVIWISICQGLTVGGLIFARDYLPNESAKIAFDVVSIISFIGIAGTVVFVLYIRITNERMQQLLLTERELKKMQQQYYTVLLEREADTRKYRHDMNNHLLCLYAFSQKGKTEELQNYVLQMKEDFTSIQKKGYTTGNDIMDILLSYHLSNLQETDISVIGQCTNKLAINDVDFCTVFSNVIQNSVEEIKRQQGKHCYLKVKIQQGSQYLSLEVKNSSKLVWNKNDIKLTTAKKDKKNHGLGLENIRETVAKNGGRFEFSGDGREVTAKIILPYE